MLQPLRQRQCCNIRQLNHRLSYGLPKVLAIKSNLGLARFCAPMTSDVHRSKQDAGLRSARLGDCTCIRISPLCISAKPAIRSHWLPANLPSCGGGNLPPCRAASRAQQFAGCLNPTMKCKDAQRTHFSTQIFLSKLENCSLGFSLGARGIPFPAFLHAGALHFPFTDLLIARQQLKARHQISRLMLHEGAFYSSLVSSVVNWDKTGGGS